MLFLYYTVLYGAIQPYMPQPLLRSSTLVGWQRFNYRSFYYELHALVGVRFWWWWRQWCCDQENREIKWLKYLPIAPDFQRILILLLSKSEITLFCLKNLVSVQIEGTINGINMVTTLCAKSMFLSCPPSKHSTLRNCFHCTFILRLNCDGKIE